MAKKKTSGTSAGGDATKTSVTGAAAGVDAATDAGSAPPRRKRHRATNPIIPDVVDPDNLTEQLKTIHETGTQGMRRQVNSSVNLAYTYGGKPRGTRGGNFPNQQMRVIEQDDEKRAFLAKVIQNNLVFFKMGLANPVKSDDELCERLNFYFSECSRTQQLATVEKLGLCLGLSVQTMQDLDHGVQAGFSPVTGTIIRTAKNMIAAIDAEMAAEGRIQPVVYLFRAKNFYGLKDTQDVVITPHNPLGELRDSATIEAKYDELPE